VHELDHPPADHVLRLPAEHLGERGVDPRDQGACILATVGDARRQWRQPHRIQVALVSSVVSGCEDGEDHSVATADVEQVEVRRVVGLVKQPDRRHRRSLGPGLPPELGQHDPVPGYDLVEQDPGSVDLPLGDGGQGRRQRDPDRRGVPADRRDHGLRVTRQKALQGRLDGVTTRLLVGHLDRAVCGWHGTAHDHMCRRASPSG